MSNLLERQRAQWHVSDYEFGLAGKSPHTTFDQAVSSWSKAYVAAKLFIRELEREREFGGGRSIDAKDLRVGDYLLNPLEGAQNRVYVCTALSVLDGVLRIALRPVGVEEGESLEVSPSDSVYVYRMEL